MSVAVPVTPLETIDQHRAEALSQAVVSHFPPDGKQISPDIEVDASSKFTRLGLVTSRVLRAAGIVSFAVGSYSAANNGMVEINQAKDAIVEDIGDVDSSAMDRSLTRLVTGTSRNPDADIQTVAEGQEAIQHELNDENGIDELIEQGGQAAVGVQDATMGVGLFVVGQTGVHIFKKRRQKHLSYLDDHWAPHQLFVPPRRTHTSRLDSTDHSKTLTLRQLPQNSNKVHQLASRMEKISGMAAGAVLLSSLGISAPLAEAADNTATSVVDEIVIERVQEPLFEGMAERYKDAIAADLEQAVEAELPKFMEALNDNPAAKKGYEDTVAKEYKNNENQVERLAEVDPNATFFSRMRNRLHNIYGEARHDTLVLASAFVAGAAYWFRRRNPAESKTGKTRVSQMFFDTHVNS